MPDFFIKLYNKSYFEAARRLEKRSLLGVNEHFPDKADAERALLDSFIRRIPATSEYRSAGVQSAKI